MATFLLGYDILDVSCGTCGEGVQLSGADPRRRAEGYGFGFSGKLAYQAPAAALITQMSID